MYNFCWQWLALQYVAYHTCRIWHRESRRTWEPYIINKDRWSGGGYPPLRINYDRTYLLDTLEYALLESLKVSLAANANFRHVTLICSIYKRRFEGHNTNIRTLTYFIYFIY